MKSRLSGNEAVAYAMKQIDTDVMGAITIRFRNFRPPSV